MIRDPLHVILYLRNIVTLIDIAVLIGLSGYPMNRLHLSDYCDDN